MAAWDQGDLFLIPCLNGGYLVGQVLQKRHLPDRVALCAFTLRQHGAGGALAPLTVEETIAVDFVQTDLLDNGTWQIAGLEAIPRHPHFATPRDIPDDHEPRLSAVIEAFLNACLGLYPWDGFGRGYFEDILLEGLTTPKAARTKAELQ